MGILGSRPRERRRHVALPASLRSGGPWGQVILRNVSARGLTIATRGPAPPRGTYVDIRRGTTTLTGRVQWSVGECIGVRLQDPIDVQALVDAGGTPFKTEPTVPAAKAKPAGRTAERGRTLASAMQFAVVVAAPAGAIAWLAWTLGDQAAAPLKAILAALG